jgi:endonuclease/exonuclease/phosphatase family metal-dependent hydrolase
MTRILTYNVHRCVGPDRRLDVGRVADVIAAQAPDIVALQEVDVGRARTGGVDQAHAIAERLGMTSRFHPALKVEEELYGDAILTALPERLIKAGPLPGYPRLPRLEPRGALWVAITVGGVDLQVLNTHLGLVPREQDLQAAAIMGHDWLGRWDRRNPLIVLGDFNVGGWGGPYRALSRGMSDARKAVGSGRRTATFPSRLPVREIDHVLVSSLVTVRSVHAPRDAGARHASDHLPLVVDFDVGTVVSAGAPSLNSQEGS